MTEGKPEGGYLRGVKGVEPGTRRPERLAELKELIGHNTIVRARFRRHGDKADPMDSTSKSALSPRGKERTAEVARNTPIHKDGLFVRSSPVTRARETADIILEDARTRGLLGGAGEQPHEQRQIRFRHELRQGGLKAWDEMIQRHLPPNFDNLNLDPETRQRYIDAGDDEVLDEWFKGKYPNDGSPSTREVAAEMAVLVSRVVEMPDKLWNGSEIDEEFDSHNSKLEPILKEIILRRVVDKESGEEKVVRGFDSIKEIGGGIRFAESWDLVAQKNANGEKSVKLLLRGNEYDIDLARLEKLRQQGIAMARERRK